YTDLNPTSYVTEYRLKQTDLNTAYRLSQLVAVRGNNPDAGHVIYPNPAVNNTIKIRFKANETSYDVDLVDVSGRLIKRYQNISGEDLQIDHVTPGVYILRITDRLTKAVTSERVLVYN
ncbi:MAG: T9SS type A sorting domain-containing protein, partial [Ferruginibacter sp.]